MKLPWFAALVLLSFFRSGSFALAQTGRPVDPPSQGVVLASSIHGIFETAPPDHPTREMPSGATIGNGDLGLVLEGGPDALRFYIGKSDFWGIERGGIIPVGSQILSIPQLAGATYSVAQNIGPATLTGRFQSTDGTAGLAMTSWVSQSENLAVTRLTNAGPTPLTVSSKLLDNYGTAGNCATFGANTDETSLRVSPDNVPIVEGASFTGRIAGLALYNRALPANQLPYLDESGVPSPLLPWYPASPGDGNLIRNAGDPHGGSVAFSGGPGQRLNLGVLCLPQSAFTVSGWVQVGDAVPDGTIFSAIATDNPKSYPFFRGLTFGVAGGKLTATLNYTTVTAPLALPTGAWTQVAVEYDVTSLSLIVNGHIIATTSNFPTAADQMGFDKLAIHLGDKGLPYSGCAPQGIVRQSVQGVAATVDSSGNLNFTLPPGSSATVLLAVVTDRNRWDYVDASEKIVHFGPEEIAHLDRARLNWWTSFWSRSYVQIPDTMVQASWYGSLYLLACCSAPDCPPPGLWGNFSTNNGMNWYGDYTLDYNYEATFWAAYCTNHQELADNYDSVLLSQMSRGYATAKYASLLDENRTPESLAAMPNASQLATSPVHRSFQGIYYYCHLIPTPGWSDDYGTFWGQKTDALFGAVDMVQRWRYTHDIAYAKKVYPFLFGVAQFWDNYLVLQNGHYASLDDSVCESSGPNTNPATTLSFLRLFYPSLIDISRLLNVNMDKRARWQDLINRLSPFTIVPASSLSSLAYLGPSILDGRNVIRDSEVGPQFPHPAIDVYQDHQQRASSAGMNQTQTIFPGWSFGLENSVSDRAAALNTVTIAAEWYDMNNDCTFYPAAADIGYDPVQILQNLDALLETSQTPNFIIHTAGGGTEDFSVVPVTLAAMFVQSYQSSIHVFPNWPMNQDASFGGLNACGGFLVSSALTDGKIPYVRIESTAGQTCSLVNPWGNGSVKITSNKSAGRQLRGKVLTFPTVVGKTYVLTP